MLCWTACSFDPQSAMWWPKWMNDYNCKKLHKTNNIYSIIETSVLASVWWILWTWEILDRRKKTVQTTHSANERIILHNLSLEVCVFGEFVNVSGFLVEICVLNEMYDKTLNANWLAKIQSAHKTHIIQQQRQQQR